MRPIYCADSETDPFYRGRFPKPFIWGLYSQDDYVEFSEKDGDDFTDQFVKHVSQIDCVVYAHNGGKFDWFFILKHLDEFEPLMVIAGRLAKFKIGKAEFRDSYNILPIPLSAYQKDEIDYSIFEATERRKPQNWNAIRRYLKTDCQYLFELVTGFIDNYGFNLTLAGAALAQWRKIADQATPKSSQHFYDQIKPYYYGGRVEAFAQGTFTRDFKVVDINSAYPWAMKKLHPYGTSFNESDTLPKSQGYIERSFITLECISKGALPFKGIDSLEFPDDDIARVYTITGWEYLAGLRTKTIGNIKIIKVITFTDSIGFDDYVDYFYDKKTLAKNADDRAEYIYSKLFLNSLYGKFASNPEKYKEYEVVRPSYIEAAEDNGFNFNGLIDKWALMSRPLPEDKQNYLNVAVSASITGCVRAYLFESMQKCQGVLYCDTDSIMCEDIGALEIDPTTLGAWDIEADCNFGAIGGKKLYAFKTLEGNWKTASKGARLTPDEIVKVCQGVPVVYKPDNPSYSIKTGVSFVSRKIQKTTKNQKYLDFPKNAD